MTKSYHEHFIRIGGLYEGNPSVSSDFPSQRAVFILSNSTQGKQQCCSLYHIRPFLKYSIKFIHPFFRYVANSLRSVKQSKFCMKQSIQLVRVSCPTYSENLMKVDPSFFTYVANRHYPKKIGKQSCIHEVKRNTANMFQIVLWTLSDKSWKFHENASVCFLVVLLTTDRQTDRHTDRHICFKTHNAYRWFKAYPCVTVIGFLIWQYNKAPIDSLDHRLGKGTAVKNISRKE